MSMRKCKFGENVKSLRIEKGITQESFAKEFNVTSATVSRWEAGLIEPSFQTLIALSQWFNVSTDYLLGLED